MKIDMKRLAKLAKLCLLKEEEEKLLPQMQSIIAMVERFPEITEREIAVDPDNAMMLREDIPEESFARESLLENAPQAQDGCFVVPKVIE